MKKCNACGQPLHQGEDHTYSDCISYLKDKLDEVERKRGEDMEELRKEIQKIWTRGHGPLVLD